MNSAAFPDWPQTIGIRGAAAAATRFAAAQGAPAICRGGRAFHHQQSLGVGGSDGPNRIAPATRHAPASDAGTEGPFGE